jgi:outer membrane protein
VRRGALTIGLFSLVALGCEGNPFAASDGDYAKRVALERLRDVQPSRIEEFKRATPPTPEDAVAARKRFENLELLELSLEQARAEALTHNLDLRVALVNPTIAAQQVSIEEARFESAFTLRAAYSELDSPTASTLSSAQSKNLSLVPGVRIPTRTGGNATVRLPMSKNENNNSFSTLNPAYSSDLEFSLSHELLRNAGRRTNTAALRIAGYNLQATEAQTKLEVIRQLAGVDRSYWRLFQARRELDVAQQQYELASEQVTRAQRRVDNGLSPQVEVIRAQAGVADRLEAIIIAQNNVQFQQRELKRIINMPGLTVDTKTMVVPASPPDPVEYIFESDRLVAQALDNRMEMLELELRLAADAANIAFARNQTLPLLTLDYTYRINGLGGSTQDSLHTLQRNRFEDWELGLTAEIPIGNEAARSRLRSAILERIQRLSTRQARELSIKQEVLNSVDSIDAGWQRVLAARQSVILNRRTLQAEQRQFDVGGSTSTNVLDAATRLAEAEFSEARALADYQIAQVDLAFATGTLLGASRVTWSPLPEPPTKGSDPIEEIPAEPVQAVGTH